MITASESETLVRWLSTPAAYPHQPRDVEVRETHISWVFLAGAYAYKLKKPVHFDFLDFSTVAAREHACREELRLNRRLAPDFYLNVVPVTRTSAGEFRLGGAGPLIDWLVEMRRLPIDQTLDALHRNRNLRPEHIDRLANVLARFYRDLTPLPVTPDEYRHRLLAHVRGNQQELAQAAHHLPPTVVARVHAFQLACLQLEPTLFDERVRLGRIVDGHGDLRAEHICFCDPPVIFDCIEFSADFRRVDVADELAFLAAECDYLGASWVGPRLRERFAKLFGDRPPAMLVDFYKSYRACVRAKVAALRAGQLAATAQQLAAEESLRHLELADGYASAWLQPLVVAVGGLSGTGKSTLAAAIAATLGASLLRTDVIRQDLYGANERTAEVDQGIYHSAARERVYDEMFRRARGLHSERVPVVLDGTFAEPTSIAVAQRLALWPRSLFLAVECDCPAELAQQRIRRRWVQGSDASQAWPDLHDMQRRNWRPWPAEVPHIQVNTEQSVDEQVAAVLQELTRLTSGCRTGGP